MHKQFSIPLSLYCSGLALPLPRNATQKEQIHLIRCYQLKYGFLFTIEWPFGICVYRHIVTIVHNKLLAQSVYKIHFQQLRGKFLLHLHFRFVFFLSRFLYRSPHLLCAVRLPCDEFPLLHTHIFINMTFPLHYYIISDKVRLLLASMLRWVPDG